MPDHDIVRVSADFNELDEDGRLHVLTRQADRPGALRTGALVRLWDEENSTMLGRVVELAEHEMAVIQTIRGTWHNPGPAPTGDQGGWVGHTWTDASVQVLVPVPYAFAPAVGRELLPERLMLDLLYLFWALQSRQDHYVSSLAGTAPTTADPVTAAR